MEIRIESSKSVMGVVRIIRTSFCIGNRLRMAPVFNIAADDGL
jgi:hypothetical protein